MDDGSIKSVKKKSSHGGYRPGAGRKKAKALKPYPPEIKEVSADLNMTPLEYMLRVMRDPRADETRRDRMAVAAAPYVHGRGAELQLGKKERALVEARNPDMDTSLGALMAQKQQLDRDREAVVN